jgi:hypothetical protein
MPSVTAAEFTLMAIVQENDGDLITRSTNFNVAFWDRDADEGGCPSGVIISPEPPVVTVGTHEGVEDTPIDLNMTASPAPGDTTDPTVSVVFSQWPDGMTFEGNFLQNHVTGTFVALASDLTGDGITVSPPDNFSGNLTITIEVIAVNANFLSATTGEFNVSMYFDPVADEVSISIANLQGKENEVTALPITVTLQDDDESEELGANIYVQVCDNAALNGGYPVVVSSDADASVDGVSVEGYHRVPTTDGLSLTMVPAQYWHGDCPVLVVARSIESFDDLEDPDRSTATQATFGVYIAAVANAPVITAPDSISGPEDTSIPIPGLSVVSVDTVQDNGHEMLSTVFSNVPEGTLFNHGVNGGNGLWTIPVDKLEVLEIEPPQHYAGSFTLLFTAIAKELDGGDEESTSALITIEVTPVADTFEILAQKVTLEAGGTPQPLRLNIRMDDTRGTLPGELPEELMTVTLGSVPAELTLAATRGGALELDGSGNWVFSGTEFQSNGLVISGLASVGQYTITVSAFTTDGSSVLNPPKIDTFITQVVDTETSGGRSLQDVDLSVGGVFDTGVQGVRHCDSDAKVLWDSSDAAFYLPSISLDDQSHNAVTFSLSSAMPPTVNWMAVLFPLAPAGDNSCPVPVDEAQITYTANCYDYLARAYIYINVNDAPDDQIDAYLPKKCEVPEEFEGGKTIVYAVEIPCSPCSGGADGAPGTGAGDVFGDGDPTRGRTLVQTTDYSKPPTRKSLAISSSDKSDDSDFLLEIATLMQGPPRDLLMQTLYAPRRQMQEAADEEGGELLGPASRVELEFLAVGDGGDGDGEDSSDAMSANTLAGGFGSMVLATFISAIILMF